MTVSVSVSGLIGMVPLPGGVRMSVSISALMTVPVSLVMWSSLRTVIFASVPVLLPALRGSCFCFPGVTCLVSSCPAILSLLLTT